MAVDEVSATRVGASRLVAVVVTHNRLAKLQVTLAALLATPAMQLAMVIVVDNASKDGTAGWLKTQNDPRLDIRLLPDNRGGAGGFAAGMQAAMADHAPDWVVVMDDDAYPQPGAFGAFHDTDLTGWDAVAAAVYFPNGAICEMNRPSRNPFWHMPVFLRTLFRLGGRSGFHLDPAAYADDAPALQVDITSFVGFFVSKAAIAKMGYPNPALFVYGDDGIYSLRLSQQGGRIGFMPHI
ncbi:glycosyltransferase, partial [Pseudorhodobacter sp.]|uniref:glycosyltransferase n=1 Tax=Pseudorhodobacter sp. TaxID=1934400 RepID=UPI0026494438